eukprot:TRINITY_DN57697_c0_g1_i1.p1 TRINITY_DN57697_c0_g1~~TRINITY_DN57697_c0_g1_i1.p1  ORF type:complete len:106 (+),score=32.50 TRINITY_DN57697_c0_g1_i1:120-437(+)
MCIRDRLLQDVYGKHEEAEQCYRAAATADPKHSDAWYNLGVLLQNLRGQPDQAEECYRTAVAADPKDADAWYLSLIHISEPTRLLSISYAVFCLKKKIHSKTSST